MKKIRNNKKIGIYICLLIIFTILIGIMTFLFTKTKIGIMKNDDKYAEIKELFTYSIYDNQDSNNIKLLISVNCENGVEYIEEPNGNRIYGNQKQNVVFDYKLEKGQEKEFKIKEIGKTEESKKITITDKEINDNGVKLDKIYETDGYKTLDIKNVNGIENFSTSYQIGENGKWINGEGKVSIIDYDVYTTGLVNSDNTITVTAKLEDGKGNIVTSSKKFEVDTTNLSSETEIEEESLLQAIKNNDFKTGVHKVKVEDVTYSLKVYSYENDLEIQADTLYGTHNDVGTTNDNAKNMIVLKVNGNLAIDNDAKLSTYSDLYGGPKGFLVYCTGTITNNGIISMTGKGAKAEGENVYLWKNSNYETEGEKYEYVPAIGALGAEKLKKVSYNNSGQQITKGRTGQFGNNRATGRRRQWSCMESWMGRRQKLVRSRRKWNILFRRNRWPEAVVVK